MKTNDKINLGFTGVLVFCALVITGLIIRQQFFPPEAETPVRHIENWKQLKLSGQRTGPADAPVQMVEFFDYQCPFCKRVQPAIKAVMEKYAGRVALVQENFPLQTHPEAFGAAIAAECARRQGVFASYHDLLFANQDRLARHPYDSLAAIAQISDVAAFGGCVENKETKSIVTSGTALAGKLGIQGIPTFIINGTLVSGALPEPQLEGLVQQVLAKTGK